MAKKKTYFDYLRQEMGELIEQLDLSDLEKQALKQRWLDQVIWADKKADQCRRSHYRLRITTIVGGIILPALVGLNFQIGKDNEFLRTWFPCIPFALSQVIAVSVAAEEFFKYGDRWREYRKLSENLKAEGWQFMQLSGPYQYQEAPLEMMQPTLSEASMAQTSYSPLLLDQLINPQARTTHKEIFRRFTGKVEALIKDDVASYITALQEQQKQDKQQVQKILGEARAITLDQRAVTTSSASAELSSSKVPQRDTTSKLERNPPSMGQEECAYRPSASTIAPPISPNPIDSFQANRNNGYRLSPVDAPLPPRLSPVGPTTNSLPLAVPVSLSPIAAPPSQWTPLPETSIPLAPITPTPVDPLALNAKILEAARKFQGCSTAEGPDGGNQACGWSLHQVLTNAGIAPIGTNPNYVPAIAEALEGGRGQLVTPANAKAGDLVVASGQGHIGIALTDGCTEVLSNSSSNASFCWVSDINFAPSYPGPSMIYRLRS